MSCMNVIDLRAQIKQILRRLEGGHSFTGSSQVVSFWVPIIFAPNHVPLRTQSLIQLEMRFNTANQVRNNQISQVIFFTRKPSCVCSVNSRLSKSRYVSVSVGPTDGWIWSGVYGLHTESFHLHLKNQSLSQAQSFNPASAQSLLYGYSYAKLQKARRLWASRIFTKTSHHCGLCFYLLFWLVAFIEEVRKGESVTVQNIKPW